MSKRPYATAPVASTKMPPGIPYIVGNEAAERFSYYGMKSILVVFMTQYLLDSQGDLAVMSKEEAMSWFHLFGAGVYFFPILGAILADALWGKYRTIVSLSLVYCLGHLALATDETRLGLFTGLILITLGAGGIKSCVSANVGDQFGASNSHLLPKVFGWFYFAINLGSCFSTFLTPILLDKVGPGWAFGVPGILMALATLCFWLGRWKYVHIPPGGGAFFTETFSAEGIRTIAKLAIIFVFLPPFWSLFEQTGSAWVLQAQQMDLHLFPSSWQDSVAGLLSGVGLARFSWLATCKVLPSQLQTINPILVMIMIPLFSFVVYPLAGRVVRVTPLRKISTGLFVAASSFGLCGLIETWIQAGGTPRYTWQLLAYILLTVAEIMVSITCLEFSYTQAPKKMKSLVMGVYLLAISLGNFFASAVNFFIQNPDGSSKLPGASYYWFFTALMAVVAILFVPVAACYREKTYIQDEQPAE
ncbi:MAG: POT family MFS transporter [Planctomycetia bacterium]|nr:POT family MFS transporter [Planctomycetia bacterium]